MPWICEYLIWVLNSIIASEGIQFGPRIGNTLDMFVDDLDESFEIEGTPNLLFTA